MNKLQRIWNYSQPEFYKFNNDSVWLSKIVISYILENNDKDVSLIDIGAGCGVIGLEIFQSCDQKISKVDLLELQPEFQYYLRENVNYLNSSLDNTVNILIQDVFDNHRCDYNIVVFNPPYFFENQGRVSPNSCKRKCRTFLEAKKWKEYFKESTKYISEKGGMFFVCPLTHIEILDKKYLNHINLIEKKKELGIFSFFHLHKD